LQNQADHGVDLDKGFIASTGHPYPEIYRLPFRARRQASDNFWHLVEDLERVLRTTRCHFLR